MYIFCKKNKHFDKMGDVISIFTIIINLSENLLLNLIVWLCV